jgi:hypothetical protein
MPTQTPRREGRGKAVLVTLHRWGRSGGACPQWILPKQSSRVIMGIRTTRITLLVLSIFLAMTSTEMVAQTTAMAQQAARNLTSEWPQQQAIALSLGGLRGLLPNAELYGGLRDLLRTAKLYGGPWDLPLPCMDVLIVFGPDRSHQHGGLSWTSFRMELRTRQSVL